ncbi:MAG TPA: hypothetical protein VHX63_15410 [Acidobacteriaceae bacterium]|jgi:hypothetical protein|nr:hypothetical protein [Acidobacteriaceae bacterium]
MAIRIGAEDKKKLAIASVLGILAIFLIIRTALVLFGGPSAPPAPVIAENPTPNVYRANAQPGEAQKLESATSLDPTLHPEKMRFAETTLYAGNGRNIFSKNSLPPVSQVNIEKPIASARTGPAVPAGPPPPPPIDLKFYGFATEQNGQKRVFLLHGEDIFIAGVGDIVNRRYRVLQILPRSVVIQDLSYNDTQTLPLKDN